MTRSFNQLRRRGPKLRRLVCLVRGHPWGPVETASFGPIGHDSADPAAPDPDMEWEFRQCEFCYLVEDVASAPDP